MADVASLPSIQLKLEACQRRLDSLSQRNTPGEWSRGALQEAMDMFDDVARQAEAAEMCLAGCSMAAEDYQAELRSQLPASSGRLIITDEEQERVYRRWHQAWHHAETLVRLAHRSGRQPAITECWVRNFQWSIFEHASAAEKQAMASSPCFGKASFLWYPSCDLPALLSAASGSGGYL